MHAWGAAMLEKPLPSFPLLSDFIAEPANDHAVDWYVQNSTVSTSSFHAASFFSSDGTAQKFLMQDSSEDEETERAELPMTPPCMNSPSSSPNGKACRGRKSVSSWYAADSDDDIQPAAEIDARCSRKSLSSWYAADSDDDDDDAAECQPAVEIDGDHQTTTASDGDPQLSGSVSPRKSGSPTRKTRSSRSNGGKKWMMSEGQGTWQPSGAASCPQERRVCPHFFAIGFGDDSSDGEEGPNMVRKLASAIKTIGKTTESVAVQLFNDRLNDQDAKPLPMTPRTALMKTADCAQGRHLGALDLRHGMFSGQRKSGGDMAPGQRRRRHTLCSAPKHDSDEDSENAIGPQVIVICEEPEERHLVVSSCALPPNDIDNAIVKDKRSPLKRYEDFLRGLERESKTKAVNPITYRILDLTDFRSTSSFEPKVEALLRKGKNDLDLKSMSTKGKRVAAMTPDELSKNCKEMFIPNRSNKRDKVVIMLSRRYTEIFNEAMGLDYDGPSMQGGAKVVMELLDDLGSGAWSFASSFWKR